MPNPKRIVRGIRKVAVLGAGVMGSRIAAYFAGLGYPVVLLDLAGPKTEPNQIVMRSLKRLMDSKPADMFSPSDLALIQVGNFESDLHLISSCDLVIEAIKEDKDTKQALYAQLGPLLSEKTIICSNTSGISIEELSLVWDESVKKRFLGMHFFTPVRYMPLVELIASPSTSKEVLEQMVEFCSECLGKQVVLAHDTPNFVANRIGMYALLSAIEEGLGSNLSVEEMDALFGVPMGRPKSGIFRTLDVVGIDTVHFVATASARLLIHDEERALYTSGAARLLASLVQRNLLGDKTGSGFYQKTEKGLSALDLASLAYRAVNKVKIDGTLGKDAPLKDRIEAIINSPTPTGNVAARALFRTLAYASKRMGVRFKEETQSLDPVICKDILQIDQAMRAGFGWEKGPFELWDLLGVRQTLDRMKKEGIVPACWVEKRLKEGHETFYQNKEGTTYFYSANQPSYQDAKPDDVRLIRPQEQAAGRLGALVLKNQGAAIEDLGDGVGCLRFYTKMNSIDKDVIDMMRMSVEQGYQHFDALVIGNSPSDVFCAGANLFLILMAASEKKWSQLDEIITSFQSANMLIQSSRIPIVAAPFGLTLGGGTELVLHAPMAQAAMELYMGLVEVGVGVIPAGGGCKELLARALCQSKESDDLFSKIRQIFQTIALAKVSSSAKDAKMMGLLREQDGISIDKGRHLYEAKQLALGLSKSGYRPITQRTFRLPGESAYATLVSWLTNMRYANQITDHDVVVGTELARVLTGGATSSSLEVTEQYVLDLEKESFLRLCGEPKTQERMMYMLANNKPLRN